MRFQTTLTYPLPVDDGTTPTGYFETTEYAKARLEAFGLDPAATVGTLPELSDPQLVGQPHEISVLVEVAPDLNEVPDSIRRFLPPRIKLKIVEVWPEYEENCCLDQPVRPGHWEIEFANLPVQVQAGWELTVDTSRHTCQRTITGEVKVRIPLLGRTVEEKIVSQIVPQLVRKEEKLATQWVGRQ